MSELARPLKLAAYALTALLLAGYAVVLWWAAHPTVPQNYRAYYIDQSTTCMDQPVPGTYTLGTIVSYLPDGGAIAKPTKPCGWEGPVGDGTHAVGTSARLRFNWGEPASEPLMLSLDMVALTRDGVPMPQAVDVTVNDRRLTTLRVDAGAPRHFTIPLPADIAPEGRVDVLLDFPDSVQMGPTDPPTRWRSIKLLSAGLLPS